MLTPATFVAAFPMFADVSTTDIKRLLDTSVSGGWFDVGAWGGQYDRGLGFWVAHSLVMEAALAGRACGGAAGSQGLAELASLPIIQKTVDTVSVVYSAQLLMKQVADPFLRTY